MNQLADRGSLLASALKDEKFLAALREEARDQWAGLYSALQGGIEHPNAQYAIDWIDQLVEENQDWVASYKARECGDEYLITVHGFDRLCHVRASEYGTFGPFPNFEDAMQFIEQNWTDQLTNDTPQIYKTTQYTPKDSSKQSSPITSEQLQSNAQAHKIREHTYSRLGPNKFKRHRYKILDGDEILTAEQFIFRFSRGIEAEDKILHAEISAAGWPEIAAEVVRTRIQVRRESEEIERQRQTALSVEAVAFIDAFLAGRDDPDGKLITEAALRWARGTDSEAAGSDDESEAPHHLAGRDRYWIALNAYERAKDSKKKRDIF